MPRIPAANRIRGHHAEVAFKQWLNRSRLGYMVVDQTPFSVPIGAKHIKRPDYLIGLMSIGMVAVDVKGRDMVDGHGIIELDEHDGFNFFQRYFSVPVWYAWYPYTDHDTCLLFRNTDIKTAHRKTLNRRTVYAVPREVMTLCKPVHEGFDYALFMASRIAE